MKAPFPWVGGKSKVAEIVWKAFGEVGTYIEPFAGSLAVLLANPKPARIEFVNDLDGFIVNFWRAIKFNPDEVVKHAIFFKSEIEVMARGLYLLSLKDELSEKLRANPDYYDAKAAGYWVYGQCLWLGDDWVNGKGAWVVKGDKVALKENPEQAGISRKILNIGDRGIFAARSVGEYNVEITEDSITLTSETLKEYFADLSKRLAGVYILNGDWKRLMNKSYINSSRITGIFLDPPYTTGFHNISYRVEQAENLNQEVLEWCISNGDNPDLRIALCGYEGEYNLPDSWKKYEWVANTSWGTGDRKNNNENRKKERIWFSPNCLKEEE